MNSRLRQSQPSMATSQNRGSQSRTPRTLSVTSVDYSHLSVAIADEYPNPNFSLSSSGQRHYSASKSNSMSSGSYPPENDYLFSSTSDLDYECLSNSDSSFTLPVMTTAFEVDPTFEFLADDVLGTSDMGSITSQYQGQIPDVTPYTSVPMDMSMYATSMSDNVFSGYAWSNRAFTPPPEEYVAATLPQHFLCPQGLQDEIPMDQDFTGSDTTPVSKTLSHSGARRGTMQPRPIRSASERSDTSSERSGSIDVRSTKEEHGDKVKARSNPLYEAKPDKDGLYHCPMFDQLKNPCSHKATRQKCIYNKYLDSHLRPYRCKFADRGECEETRFSSNACLFRHEREAHGLHNHGVNPFLCKFPDCDRAREGNGFPRRWNQRDHMKRVHDYVEDDSTSDRHPSDQTKRRRVPSVPASTPMKRSGSSAHSKARAVAAAAAQSGSFGHAVSVARYSAPRTYGGQVQECNAMVSPISLDDVQFSPASVVPKVSRNSLSYSGAYAY